MDAATLNRRISEAAETLDQLGLCLAQHLEVRMTHGFEKEDSMLGELIESLDQARRAATFLRYVGGVIPGGPLVISSPGLRVGGGGGGETT